MRQLCTNCTYSFTCAHATIPLRELTWDKRIDTRDQPDVWRRDLRVKITWALAAKLLGLLLLWFLFFRGSGS